MSKFVVTFKYGGSLFQGVQDHPAFDYVSESMAEAAYNRLIAYHGGYGDIEIVSIARHSNTDGGGQTVYNVKRIEPRAASWEITSV